ncbi:YdeI/OmpD-associated family protein [Asticcacaulis solisilvae]|uniref:YdeI/OmpD-associated family protein n=1 Tax=Asticcacaulis solisilvae TaxID=1217274 RepID=UPI003FD6FD70
MMPTDYQAFATPDDLSSWLRTHHATERELWVRMYKKASGTPSVTWEDCVVAALAWGWIDSQKQALDDVSSLQRLTPRRSGSNWSKKNCEHAERLIAEGLMQPAGLAHVEAARADGRWENAYAASSTMVIPQDFLAELAKDAGAQAFYDTLGRTSLFSIYHRLQTAKRPETRQKRMDDILGKLGRREKI